MDIVKRMSLTVQKAVTTKVKMSLEGGLKEGMRERQKDNGKKKIL